ncbi:MAG: hypothetical protein JWM82_2308 [Myxococcales bacterium]|nr:hypothetical protein [Myxococcales bacterium]
MNKVFPELPEWSFEIQETSTGGYQVTATNKKGGRTFDMKGTDREALVAECREEAAALSEQTQFERP